MSAVGRVSIIAVALGYSCYFSMTALIRTVLIGTKNGQFRPVGHIFLSGWIAPSEHVRARDDAKLIGPRDAGEVHEVVQVNALRAAGAQVAEIHEPFGFGRHCRELLKLRGGQARLSRPRF